MIALFGTLILVQQVEVQGDKCLKNSTNTPEEYRKRLFIHYGKNVEVVDQTLLCIQYLTASKTFDCIIVYFKQ